jgi:hypothetical protein
MVLEFAFANAHEMFAPANGKPRSPASTQVDAANFKFAACAREGVTCQIKSGAKHLRSLSCAFDVIRIDRFLSADLRGFTSGFHFCQLGFLGGTVSIQSGISTLSKRGFRSRIISCDSLGS